MTSGLVLSLFPGIDLLGRSFEAEGFCIVRGPDLLWGGDIRTFKPPPHVFAGIIAGSPCQDFSKVRRSKPTGYGHEMLTEFIRIVDLASPDWWLLENVPTVPDVIISKYITQRLDLNARECGSSQNRPRHFQFGTHLGLQLVPARACPTAAKSQPTALATEGRHNTRRTWPDFCELQGLPRDFTLPGLTRTACYAAVGNGVHVAVARTLARAILDAYLRDKPLYLCACHCGRPVTGRQIAATPACRKRLQRRRDLASVTNPDTVTPAHSRD
jgi:DNA (cytosine-5)-methyltransferase 1